MGSTGALDGPGGRSLKEGYMTSILTSLFDLVCWYMGFTEDLEGPGGMSIKEVFLTSDSVPLLGLVCGFIGMDWMGATVLLPVDCQHFKAVADLQQNFLTSWTRLVPKSATI